MINRLTAFVLLGMFATPVFAMPPDNNAQTAANAIIAQSLIDRFFDLVEAGFRALGMDDGLSGSDLPICRITSVWPTIRSERGRVSMRASG
jgi:hypothetical protein